MVVLLGSSWFIGKRLNVLHLAGLVGFVGAQVEQPMSGEIEQKHALLARVARLDGLLCHRRDGMG